MPADHHRVLGRALWLQPWPRTTVPDLPQLCPQPARPARSGPAGLPHLGRGRLCHRLPQPPTEPVIRRGRDARPEAHPLAAARPISAAADAQRAIAARGHGLL